MHVKRLFSSCLRILLPCLAAVALAGLASCGQEEDAERHKPRDSHEFKVGVLYVADPNHDPKGFSAAQHDGILAMRKALHLKPRQILERFDIGAENADFAIRELLAQGARLIIATSRRQADAALALAKQTPEATFAILGAPKNDLPGNAVRFVGRAYEARYLAGIAAGLNTKKQKIGYLAPWGPEDPGTTRGVAAFALGVAQANPKAKVYVRVLGDWYAPLRETLDTRALAKAGCDVIVQHSDTAIPVREAAEAGVLAIGDNNDVQSEAPHTVLASVAWHWQVYYIRLVQALLSGKKPPQNFSGGIADGLVDLTRINRDLAKPGTQQAVDAARQRIRQQGEKAFAGLAGDWLRKPKYPPNVVPDPSPACPSP
jgi:basic membrane protein A